MVRPGRSTFALRRAAVHFFDIASDAFQYRVSGLGRPQSFSPNTLRTRLSLNYKGIRYSESFIPYPDIEALWKELNIKPATPQIKGKPACTLPVILLATEKFGPEALSMLEEIDIPVGDPVEIRGIVGNPVSTALGIAMTLDMLYPQPEYPPLFPDERSFAQTKQVQSVITSLLPSSRRLIIPSVPAILDNRSRKYFTRTRQEWFGVSSLDELRPKTQVEADQIWSDVEERLQPVLQKLTASARHGKRTPSGGIFLNGGPLPTYEDFVLMGFMAWFMRVDMNAFEQLTGIGGGVLQDFWLGCTPWLDRWTRDIVDWEDLGDTIQTSR